MIDLGKGERYSPRFQFQVVLEVLMGDREPVEIAQKHKLLSTMLARQKKFLENGSLFHEARNVREGRRIVNERIVSQNVERRHSTLGNGEPIDPWTTSGSYQSPSRHSRVKELWW